MGHEHSPPSGAADGAPTPEMIERFRQVGLRLDRSGRLWHQGREVTHPRLRRAILGWLDRRESDGRPIIRLDAQRYAYIDVDDAELLVTSARWDGDRVFIATNDGAEQELEYDTLRVADDHALYCGVRGGRLEARLTTPAFHTVARGIEEQSGGSFALCAAGSVYPIGYRPPRDGAQ